MKRKQLIAFNLLFVEKQPLSGPGYYAVQLFEHLIRLSNEKAARYNFIAFVQEGTEHHFSEAARQRLAFVPAFTGRWARVLFEQIRLPFRVRARQVDLLFSPGFVSPVWGAPHKVATICDMYYRAVPDMVEPSQGKYWNVFIPLTARVCERIITISQNSLRDIERFLPVAKGKSVSIPLASRFPVADNGTTDPATPPFVLMVANLTPNKNCEIVVEAVARLRREGSDIRLVHAGKDNRDLLAASILAHDAGEFVASLGKVTDAQLAELYRTSLCVVVPSLYEGFGMPAIEAQALGAPLVCSNSSALPEAAGEAALFFDPRSSEALTAQLRRLLVEPQLRQDLIEQGFRNASRFSWDENAARTLDIFDEVIGGIER